MAPKLRWLTLVFYMLAGTASGQVINMDQFSNRLFLNVFTEQQDPGIQNFLKTYIPALAEKKKREGVWIKDHKKEEKEQEEVHSFVFSKHPFFTPNFASGKLEFICVRNGDAASVKITDVKLWFEFDTQQDGEMAFSYFAETLSKISTSTKFSVTNGAQKGEFTDARETKGFGKVRVRLTADNLDRRTFKILFETENDL